METHKSCPICFEIPEQEIYQCSNGHIICATCIPSLFECPQCRIPYGEIKIRSRVLEEILDSQKYNCNFSAEGCTEMCDRKEITKHANSCCYSPSYIPLCEIIGYQDCKFNFSHAGQQDIIDHMKDKHDIPCERGDKIKLLHRDFLNATKEKSSRFWTPILLKLGKSGNESLVLLLGQLVHQRKFISYIYIHLWGSKKDSNTSQLKFSLEKETSIEEPALSVAASSEEHHLQISWILSACSIINAKCMLETNTLCIPVRLIAGDYMLDNGSFAVKIQEFPNSLRLKQLNKLQETEILTHIRQPISKVMRDGIFERHAFNAA